MLVLLFLQTLLPLRFSFHSLLPILLEIIPVILVLLLLRHFLPSWNWRFPLLIHHPISALNKIGTFFFSHQLLPGLRLRCRRLGTLPHRCSLDEVFFICICIVLDVDSGYFRGHVENGFFLFYWRSRKRCSGFRRLLLSLFHLSGFAYFSVIV